MNRNEAINALRLFIEKASKLVDSGFVKSLENSGLTLSGGAGKPLKVTRLGPNQQEIDAFVLTFRFFIQGKDRISPKEFKAVFHSEFTTQEERTTFDKVRAELDEFLHGPSALDDGGKITREELMHAFIYGGLAHANVSKKERYDKWMANPSFAGLIENEFVLILDQVLVAVM